MPIRMIRDSILDSDRYWSVSIEARQLFFHMLLLADDLGLIHANAMFLGRRCFAERPTNQKIAALLQELVNVDLVRTYQVENADFAYIPRFGQRLRTIRRKCPLPPQELYSDERDALQKFKEYQATFGKSVSNPPQSAAICGLKGSEGNRREEEGKRSPELSTAPSGWWRTQKGIEEKARECCITANGGETYQDLKERIFEHLKKSNSKSNRSEENH